MSINENSNMGRLVAKHRAILENKAFGAIDPISLGNMALLLENQSKEMKQYLTENSKSADIQNLATMIMPIVRRVYPKLIANTIAGVQTLQTPEGALFAMTARYLGTKADAISPTNKGQIIVVKGETTQDEADLANQFTKGVTLTGATNTGSTGKIVYAEHRKVLVELTGDAFKAGEKLTLNTKNYVITEVYSNEAHFIKIFENYTGPMDTATGETLGSEMAALGLTVEKVNAVAKTRAIRADYTMEMLTDLKNTHNVDGEKEIMDMLGKELQLEIDREVIKKVNSVATVLPDLDITQADGRWSIEKFKQLSMKIANEAREIGRKTRRGNGNVLLVSPTVATALEQVGNFVLSPSKSSIDAVGSGLNPILGTFDGKYKVVVDNFADSEYFTVLYRGANDNKDAGVFFAPYYGLTFTKVLNPEDGQPSVILKTRYDIVTNPLTPEHFMRTAAVNLGKII